MSKRIMGRRRFLASAAGAGLTVPSLLQNAWAQGQPPPVRNSQVLGGAIPTKTVLSGSDFTLLGSFRMPSSAAGGDGSFGRGLTLRYVNGELRFLSIAWNPQVLYEVVYPGDDALTAAVSSAPVASISQSWGDVSAWGANRATDRFGLNSGQPQGLYWDHVDQRLYFGYGDTYNTTSPNDPSVSYCTLNDDGTVTNPGCWRVGPSCKMTMGGVTAVPSWFASRFTGGRRLAAGFGGYWSIVAMGPASMGPSLFAFAPPTTQATRSTLSYSSLLGYPYSATPYGTPDRCHRDTNYTNDFDGWNPRNGVGYWSWTDYLWQGGVWIDLPNKHGVVFFPTLGDGRTWYQTSTLHATNASHWWYVYDPTTLALVASGAKQPSDIQPSQRWSIQYPGLSYPLPGWSDEPLNMVVGVAYDDSTQRLYVAVRWPWNQATGVGGHVVSVYQVNG